MKTSNEVNISFYKILGQLFYAIAASDKKVRPEEIVAFKQILISDWLPIDTAAIQIEKTFDELHKKSANISDFIADLRSFKKANEELFTSEMNTLIKKTCSVIASAVSRKNKSEIVMISQLYFILDR